ncbi:MAG TPA: cation diffusion facilitator family transporter [Thermoleophilia bacterium]|nr:cation diffusion facilitator family transporter [Thermoleophilia bacterium]
METQGRKTRAALISVASNTTLTLLKLLVGIAIGSVGVLSEAIHSGIDLIASVIALFAVRRSGRPADEEHPFGHGKVENISGVAEALLIFVAAGWIIFEAVGKLRHPEPLETIGWGVGIMLLSAVANLWVSRMLFRVGKETASVALQADGWHLRTDVFTSAGVMGGLALIVVGQRVFPALDLDWIDPMAGIVVALLIVRAAYRLTTDATRDLMDSSLADEEIWIRAHLADLKPSIRGYHKLRTRRAGNTRFVDVHVLLDSSTHLDQAHEISQKIEDAVRDRFPGTSLTVHMEPCDADCAPICVQGCLLDPQERGSLTGR